MIGRSVMPTGYCSVYDYAKKKSVTENSVRRWIRDGKIPGAYKFDGEHWAIPCVVLRSYQNDKPRYVDATELKKHAETVFVRFEDGTEGSYLAVPLIDIEIEESKYHESPFVSFMETIKDLSKYEGIGTQQEICRYLIKLAERKGLYFDAD